MFTAHIVSGPPRSGYDLVVMVRDADRVCTTTLHVRHSDGMVTWASDWAAVPELEQAGQLKPVHRGPETYGHVDLYFI